MQKFFGTVFGRTTTVEVDDVVAALARAGAAGATYTQGPADLGGFILGVFDDPEGNRIGLVQRSGH